MVVEAAAVDMETPEEHAMGSTICNIVAVCLRAGWMMGVQGRYFKHEGAGDCYVGRACAGNPINSLEFVKLPPRFIRSDENDKIVALAIKEAFPTLAGKGNMDGVLALLLAFIFNAKGFIEGLLLVLLELILQL